MTFERFAIHAVEFPFSESSETKNRPALIISDDEFTKATGNILLAMITTAKNSKWLYDCRIENWKKAGLPVACIVRMKFSASTPARIGEYKGRLTDNDRKKVAQSLRECLGL